MVGAKGVHHLIDALEPIAGAAFGIHLDIVGTGDLRAQVVQVVRPIDNVTFHGAQTHEWVKRIAQVRPLVAPDSVFRSRLRRYRPLSSERGHGGWRTRGRLACRLLKRLSLRDRLFSQ
ncbi:glycosyltransferase family 4 protein [Vibrio chagasii]|nr:glycosyltransferase family 4 protein [Vibrio chagasii]